MTSLAIRVKAVSAPSARNLSTTTSCEESPSPVSPITIKRELFRQVTPEGKLAGAVALDLSLRPLLALFVRSIPDKGGQVAARENPVDRVSPRKSHLTSVVKTPSGAKCFGEQMSGRENCVTSSLWSSIRNPKARPW